MVNPQKEKGHTPIANEIMDALIKSKIPINPRQCLDLILRKTYGWNKKEDGIPLSQFVVSTGIRRSHVCRSLNILRNMNLITITSRGNDSWKYYMFNKHFDTWKPLPARVIVTRGGNASLPGEVTSVTRGGNASLPGEGHSITSTSKTTTSKTFEKATPAFSDNCIEMKIFKALEFKVKVFRPNHKFPTPAVGCKIFRLMLSKEKHGDKRLADEVLDLIAWYPIGEQFIPEAFCPKAFREKYDKLISAREREKQEAQNGQRRINGFGKTQNPGAESAKERARNKYRERQPEFDEGTVIVGGNVSGGKD